MIVYRNQMSIFAIANEFITLAIMFYVAKIQK